MKSYVVKIVTTELVERLVTVSAESRTAARHKIKKGDYQEQQELERHRKGSQVVSFREEK